MTNPELIAAIREKCVAANPEKFTGERLSWLPNVKVTLADVLLAISETPTERVSSFPLSITCGGHFYVMGKLIASWNLKDDLSLQSTETLQFIFNLLK